MGVKYYETYLHLKTVNVYMAGYTTPLTSDAGRVKSKAPLMVHALCSEAYKTLYDVQMMTRDLSKELQSTSNGP